MSVSVIERATYQKLVLLDRVLLAGGWRVRNLELRPWVLVSSNLQGQRFAHLLELLELFLTLLDDLDDALPAWVGYRYPPIIALVHVAPPPPPRVALPHCDYTRHAYH